MKYSPNLLPRESLVITGPVDHAEWNYRPFLGFIQRKRFRLALGLLGVRNYPRLLEIGYGSGVFMPALRARCRELYGIDVHSRQAEVSAALARQKVTARLLAGSMAAMPFEDGYFDAIVCISALEFVDDITGACAEISRVLTKDGVLVVVTPGDSALVDFGLKVLTRASAEQDFGDRREAAFATLTVVFRTLETRNFPPGFPRALRLYHGLKLAHELA